MYFLLDPPATVSPWPDRLRVCPVSLDPVAAVPFREAGGFSGTRQPDGIAHVRQHHHDCCLKRDLLRGVRSVLGSSPAVAGEGGGLLQGASQGIAPSLGTGTRPRRAVSRPSGADSNVHLRDWTDLGRQLRKLGPISVKRSARQTGAPAITHSALPDAGGRSVITISLNSPKLPCKRRRLT